MAPKENTVLIQILQGQTELTTEVKNLNTRLFGAEGQKGAIPVLFDKHEALAIIVQDVKDEALAAVQKTKDVEIGGLKKAITDLQTQATITLWKTGTISSIAGSGVGVAATYLIKRIFGGH